MTELVVNLAGSTLSHQVTVVVVRAFLATSLLVEIVRLLMGLAAINALPSIRVLVVTVQAVGRTTQAHQLVALHASAA